MPRVGAIQRDGAIRLKVVKKRDRVTLQGYLGLALDPKGVDGFVEEGCLERMGEDEILFSNLWEDEVERNFVLYRPLLCLLGGPPMLP